MPTAQRLRRSCEREIPIFGDPSYCKDAAATQCHSSPGSLRVHGWNGSCVCARQEDASMNLVVWLPAMFLLGLVSMTLFYAFIDACDKI